MGDFSLIKRKNSAYLPQKKRHFSFNRKSSAYFILPGTSIKDSEFYLKNSREPYRNDSRLIGI
jgi:hypothetical protein